MRVCDLAPTDLRVDFSPVVIQRYRPRDQLFDFEVSGLKRVSERWPQRGDGYVHALQKTFPDDGFMSEKEKRLVHLDYFLVRFKPEKRVSNEVFLTLRKHIISSTCK